MGVGPEWIGVIGTSAGGLIGVLGTLAIQADDRRDRRKQRASENARDDHLRDIGRRRDLYGECLAAANDLINAVVGQRLERNEPELELDANGRFVEASAKMFGLLPRVDLTAPDTVRELFRKLDDELGPTPRWSEGKDVRAQIGEQIRRQLVVAMRADLRIRDASPETTSSVTAGPDGTA